MNFLNRVLGQLQWPARAFSLSGKQLKPLKRISIWMGLRPPWGAGMAPCSAPACLGACSNPCTF